MSEEKALALLDHLLAESANGIRRDNLDAEDVLNVGLNFFLSTVKTFYRDFPELGPELMLAARENVAKGLLSVETGFASKRAGH